ncbi:MAG: hypothetical protein H7A23_07265 [Leptospiraceae bacterium]|nr:hypothetical protein [Leptospiraceae bacterium]MCP5494339.1 hypothetical protein [Leptospiraceae bacterium]
MFGTYKVLANYLNTTEIIVDREKISVRHYPLPWTGNKVVLSNDIKQLYSKPVRHQNRNSVSFTYEVHAVLSNRTHIELVSNFETSDQALYVEQEIENFLKIENYPVRGEIGRD